MKQIIILGLILFLNACTEVKKDAPVAFKPAISGNPAAYEFGPVFLPENHILTSVSLNYFTAEAEPTRVFFTMAGDIDWVRSDKTLNNYHKMVFEDLEESAQYQFTIQRKKDGIETGSLQTIPYGEEYQFSFEVADLEADLNNSTPPHFLILMADSNFIEAKDFYTFYKNNSKILASTILLPMFDWKISDKLFTLNKGGIYYFKYRKADVLLVYKDPENWDALNCYLSAVPEDENYIVLSGLNKESINKAVNLYGNVARIIINQNYAEGLEDQAMVVKDSRMIQIINKPKFAVNN